MPNEGKWLSQTKGRIWFGLILVFVSLVGALAVADSVAAAPTSSPAAITYQGKLLINNLAATTTQNMIYLIYDAQTGGNIIYTASGTIASPQAVSSTPTNGLFSVDLGGSGTNALEPGIFQVDQTMYLEVRVGSETLSPRRQITAAPYAYNARFLDGVMATTTASSSTYIPISDSSGNFIFNAVSTTGSFFTTGTLRSLGGTAGMGVSVSSTVTTNTLMTYFTNSNAGNAVVFDTNQVIRGVSNNAWTSNGLYVWRNSGVDILLVSVSGSLRLRNGQGVVFADSSGVNPTSSQFSYTTSNNTQVNNTGTGNIQVQLVNDLGRIQTIVGVTPNVAMYVGHDGFIRMGNTTTNTPLSVIGPVVATNGTGTSSTLEFNQLVVASSTSNGHGLFRADSSGNTSVSGTFRTFGGVADVGVSVSSTATTNTITSYFTTGNKGNGIVFDSSQAITSGGWPPVDGTQLYSFRNGGSEVLAITASGSLFIPNNQGLSFADRDTVRPAVAQFGFTNGQNTQVNNSTSTGNIQIQNLNDTGSIQFITGSATTTRATIGSDGLVTMIKGFISGASSTVTSTLNVNGSLNASSSLIVGGTSRLTGTAVVDGLTTLTGGFISGASSTITSSLHVGDIASFGVLAPTGSVQLFVPATSTTAIPLRVNDELGNLIGKIASTSVRILLNETTETVVNFSALTLGSNSGRGGLIDLKNSNNDAGLVMRMAGSDRIAVQLAVGNNGFLYLGSQTATTTLDHNSLILGRTSDNRKGIFYVDSSGNVSASGTLRQQGLATLVGGFISGASSTVTSSLHVNNRFFASSTLMISGGVSGGVTVSTTATSTTFTSFAAGTAPRAFILDTSSRLAYSSSTYLLSVRNLGESAFSISSDGFVSASATVAANVSIASIGDVAEYVNLVPGEAVEAGDVIVVDLASHNKYRKSTTAYATAVAGVISDSGAFVIGARGHNRAPVALAGLVHVKVTDEGGPINVGDYLVTAPTPGHAMKYDPSLGKPAGLIGMALEPHTDLGFGLIKIMINKSLAPGAPAGSPTLNVTANEQGQLVQTGDLDLAGNALLNVKSITSKSGNWFIDDSGNLAVRAVKAEIVITKKLCVDNICITESELRELLQKNGIIVPATATDTATSPITTVPVAPIPTSTTEAVTSTEPVPAPSEPTPAEPVVSDQPSSQPAAEAGSETASAPLPVAESPLPSPVLESASQPENQSLTPAEPASALP